MLSLIPIGLSFGQAQDAEIASHARVAQEAQARGDFTTAIREYQVLTKWLPDSPELASNLGVALYFHNETNGALTFLAKAERLNPKLSAPHLFSGLAWFRLSETKKAVTELQNAVRLNESDLVAHCYLGYVYLEQHQYQAALRELQVVNRSDPDNLDIAYTTGNCYLELGRAATKELLSIAPDGARVWQLAAEQFALRGDRQQALVLFSGALDRRPDLSDVRAAMVAIGATPSESANKAIAPAKGEDDLYKQIYNYEENARAAFSKIANTAPDSYRAHQVMADSALAQGRLDDAITEYRAVSTRKPDLPGIHEAIGEGLLRLAKTADALAEFRAELQLRPNSPDAQINSAKALLVLGKDDEAAQLLKRVSQASEASPEIDKLQGKIDLRRHHYADSIVRLTRYCSQVKDDGSVYYLLAQAYRSTGNTGAMKQAAAEYRRLSEGEKERTRAQKALDGFLARREEIPAREENVADLP